MYIIRVMKSSNEPFNPKDIRSYYDFDKVITYIYKRTEEEESRSIVTFVIEDKGKV